LTITNFEELITQVLAGGMGLEGVRASSETPDAVGLLREESQLVLLDARRIAGRDELTAHIERARADDARLVVVCDASDNETIKQMADALRRVLHRE